MGVPRNAGASRTCRRRLICASRTGVRCDAAHNPEISAPRQTTRFAATGARIPPPVARATRLRADWVWVLDADTTESNRCNDVSWGEWHLTTGAYEVQRAG